VFVPRFLLTSINVYSRALVISDQCLSQNFCYQVSVHTLILYLKPWRNLLKTNFRIIWLLLLFYLKNKQKHKHIIFNANRKKNDKMKDVKKLIYKIKNKKLCKPNSQIWLKELAFRNSFINTRNIKFLYDSPTLKYI